MESELGGQAGTPPHHLALSPAATNWLETGHAHPRQEEAGPGPGGDGAVLCIGELLWDSLPAGLFLGGAPFNAACHLHALGVQVEMVTRVGADRLGEEALERVRGYGISTDLIQIDPELPTGFSKVKLEGHGVPRYEIAAPAAWDAIETTPALRQHAAQARAIVFGSLAHRNAVTSATIEGICRGSALKVVDINLRAPHYDAECIRELLERADVVKLNRDELRTLQSWFALPESLHGGAAALGQKFGCQVVCVTLGEKGAALWRHGRFVEHCGYQVEVKDTVGAGDAFLAALLAGLLEDIDDLRLLKRANLVGAYVAAHTGALPAYRAGAMRQIAGADSLAALGLVADGGSALVSS